ncbi:transcriptional activator [Cryptococcus neoformans AD2-60a]|nr:transcriptional activator [Cryptococcus neoformans var. grubii AD2-60a]OXH37202.1 transcriptional activator [Cryptococcus neoformans var. grubii]
MGRKKIEIRPLTDERNRNVTFLKRKAGLMKKAWELSVLCAADVSIIIFSAAGKAFEFSSKELDSEIDRYLNYEGMIERRRAAEFAAMALAGEDDDDDDDDDTSRRGSTSKSKAAAAANGNPPPTRSLKGKETFKHRTLRPSEDRKRKREDKKQRRKSEPGEKRSFIDEIMSGGESDSEEEEKPRRRSNAGHGNGKRMSSLREADELADDVPQASRQSLDGLQYALSMHASQPSHERFTSRHRSPHPEFLAPSVSSSQTPRTAPTVHRHPSDTIPYPITNPLAAPMQASLGVPQLAVHPSYSRSPNGHPGYFGYPNSLLGMQASYLSRQPFAGAPQPSPYYSAHGPGSHPGEPPVPGLPTQVPGGQPIQWDQNLLARYAEFQLQQNHQRQQRILLEKQRQQLAELGVPLDEKNLLDEIFGGVGASRSASGGAGPSGADPGSASLMGLGNTASEGREEGNGVEFIWPLSNNAAAAAAAQCGDEDRNGISSHSAFSAAAAHHQAAYGKQHVQQQKAGWGFDGAGFEGMEEGASGSGMGLPSPVSAGAGGGRK